MEKHPILQPYIKTPLTELRSTQCCKIRLMLEELGAGNPHAVGVGQQRLPPLYPETTLKP